MRKPVELPASIMYEFPKSMATVVWKNEVGKTDKCQRFALEVMVIDQYRYQREFTLKYFQMPGKRSAPQWESHIYRHPGRRLICDVPDRDARMFCLRFLKLCETFPALLFNEAGDHTEDKARPRCEGFVSLAELLHDSYVPHKDLL